MLNRALKALLVAAAVLAAGPSVAQEKSICRSRPAARAACTILSAAAWPTCCPNTCPACRPPPR